MSGQTTTLPAQRAGLGLLATLLAAFALVLLTPGAAAAQTGSAVQNAAEALQGDPVYVDPAASDALGSGGADAVRAAIQDAGTPIYVAVLPEDAVNEAGGSIEALNEQLAVALDRPGTVGVVAGRTFAAIDDQSRVDAPAAAEDAATSSQGGSVESLLVDFAGRVGSQASGDAGGGGGAGVGVVVLGLLLVAGGGITFLAVRTKKRNDQRRQREFEEVRKVAYDDLDALGQDLRALDLDVAMPDAEPDALEHYKSGLTQYEKATSTIDRAANVENLRPVGEALAEGRYQMACTKARLDGQEIPERRPPCFFDPRHGPSVEDVQWAPMYGQPRPVPACASDAHRIRQGLEPDTRQLMINDQMTPYYNAPGYYGPYAGGYFGDMAGGLWAGMLIGSMFSPGFGFGGYGGEMGGGDMGGDFGDGGWGSGGDWGGGGDFGGGDFGGFDF